MGVSSFTLAVNITTLSKLFMKRFGLIFLLFLPALLLTGFKHPLYQIGKTDYVYEVTRETSLSDLRHPNKETIVQFAADWSTPSVRFWPYLYTLDRLRPNDYEIVVVDLDQGWDDTDQFQRELKTQFSNLPYMVILAPEAEGEELIVRHHGESGPSLNEYILAKIIETDDHFMYEFIPAVEANWNNIFLPALQIYLDAYERAEDARNNAEDARRIAKAALLEEIGR